MADEQIVDEAPNGLPEAEAAPVEVSGEAPEIESEVDALGDEEEVAYTSHFLSESVRKEKEQAAALTRAAQARLRSLEADEKRLRPFRQLHAIATTTPEVEAEMVAIMRKYGVTLPEDESTGSVPAHLEQKITALESKVEELNQNNFLGHLEGAAKRVAREYGMKPSEMQGMIRHADEMGWLHYGMKPGQVRATLETMARAQNHTRGSIAGEKRAVTKLKEKARAASPAGRPVSHEAPEPDTANMGPEAFDKFLAREAQKALRS